MSAETLWTLRSTTVIPQMELEMLIVTRPVEMQLARASSAAPSDRATKLGAIISAGGQIYHHHHHLHLCLLWANGNFKISCQVAVHQKHAAVRIPSHLEQREDEQPTMNSQLKCQQGFGVLRLAFPPPQDRKLRQQ